MVSLLFKYRKRDVTIVSFCEQHLLLKYLSYIYLLQESSEQLTCNSLQKPFASLQKACKYLRFKQSSVHEIFALSVAYLFYFLLKRTKFMSFILHFLVFSFRYHEVLAELSIIKKITYSSKLTLNSQLECEKRFQNFYVIWFLLQKPIETQKLTETQLSQSPKTYIYFFGFSAGIMKNITYM